MRKLILIALAATAVAAPVAFAASGGNPGKPAKPTPTAPNVAYVIKGTITGLDAANKTLTISLNKKGSNAHARRALKGLTSFTVKTDASTKWSFTGGKPTAFESAKVTDRVVVRYVASKKANAAALGALFAKKVTDSGPKPAA
jgi:hypothetical protein